jgi:hypothetical protein
LNGGSPYCNLEIWLFVVFTDFSLIPVPVQSLLSLIHNVNL